MVHCYGRLVTGAFDVFRGFSCIQNMKRWFVRWVVLVRAEGFVRWDRKSEAQGCDGCHYYIGSVHEVGNVRAEDKGY